ncbi:MAG: enoyl-CoA hydratase/isomerase family protein [Chloroflexi bacterium]|nr:enoyl-CoA hydratase/isomerase family protein [Chloroflexota bacterium]
MAAQPLTFRREGAVALLLLHRPPDNTVDRSLAAEMRDACGRLSEDEEVRLVVLAGEAGLPFCRGTDPAFLAEARGLSSALEARALLDAYSCSAAVAALPMPVIAAVEGEAWEQGAELALAADIRVATENAVFRFGHLGQGLVPWEGGTQRLPRLAGRGAAADLLLTGRVLAAAEAHRLGLVTRLAPPGKALDVAREVAEAILAGGPVAARYAKEAVLKGMDVSLEEGIRLETDLTMVLQTTEDRMEGIRAFLARRKPKFKGK